MSILVMPRWVAVFIGLTFAFASGVAQARQATPDPPSTGEDERAVQAVVGAQLKAFRDGDLAMAFPLQIKPFKPWLAVLVNLV